MTTTHSTFAPGDQVAVHQHGSAPYRCVWTVVRERPDRGLWTVREPDHGTTVDVMPDELIPLGRPDAIERAAAIDPLHEWDRDCFRGFVSWSPAPHSFPVWPEGLD